MHFGVHFKGLSANEGPCEWLKKPRKGLSNVIPTFTIAFLRYGPIGVLAECTVCTYVLYEL